jgi:thiol-disulfide isomerase/thioredoxin
MIKAIGTVLCLVFIASAVFNNPGWAKGEELNKPIPVEALKLVKQAKEMRTRDKFDEALAALRKAIALAPNYVEAHAAYIETKDYYMERDDEVRAEYEALLAKEPNNPVYLMAQILVYRALLTKSRQAAFGRVAELAPDWAWGHFAKAMMVRNNNPDTAIAELEQSIKLQSSSREPYYELINLYSARRDYDAAIETAKKMADFPGDFRETGQESLWQFRYRKASNSSAEEREKLKAEFKRLIETTEDLEALSGIQRTVSIFQESAFFEAFQSKIKKLDPTWYWSRGLGSTGGLRGVLGEENRTLATFNHQNVIRNDATLIHFNREMLPNEKIPQLEKMLALKPGRRATELIYHYLFEQAEKADHLSAMLKYGEVLKAMEPKSIIVPIKLALALAEKKVQLEKALTYARMAEAATAEMRRPERRRDEDPFRFQDSLLEENQRQQYNLMRATALHALGWTLYQTGNYAEAESKLQQAVALKRDKDNLYHWAASLSKLGRTAEAEKLTLEADNLLANAVKEEMNRARKEPAKGFTLETVDGRKVSLSDFKGKIVLLNFWATWCGPCIKEIPDLKRLYGKYKEKGFEILAISGDVKADRQQVIDFAKQREMNFTVLFGEETLKLYSISGLPTNIFVDRDGIVRYRLAAVGPDAPKSLEIALNELLR